MRFNKKNNIILFRIAFASILGMMGRDCAIAQVVPSGATNTTVAPSGAAINVTIAPADASHISHNKYNAFSVPVSGVNLLNDQAKAYTIINEVTSSSRSYLYGRLAVYGPTANVIVANPNGLTIDGARFQNVGHVALSSSAVSFKTNGATGLSDAVLSSASGDIAIGRGGLSGSMSTLQLVAGKLKIDGPVVNSHPDANALVNVNVQNGDIRLDSSIAPWSISGSKQWATQSGQGGASNEILIDVTPNGSISASRIHMTVGARGAGVSFAGKGMASIGEFNITAQGKIDFLGANVQAEKAVKIVAPSIAVLNRPEAQSEIASITGGVTLLASEGDIILNGVVSGVKRVDGDSDSLGGVTLRAARDISLLTERADRIAIAFSSRDDLAVSAGGGVTNNTGRLLSNARTYLTTGGALNNIVDVLNVANNGQPLIWFGKSATTYVWNYGQLRIPDMLAYIVGASVFINSGSVLNTGEIDAQSGPLLIRTGQLINHANATGMAYYSYRCGFFLGCGQYGYSNASMIGGAINSAGALSIASDSIIWNDGGVFYAADNMGLAASAVVTAGRFLPTFFHNPRGLYNAFSGPTTFLALSPVGGDITAQQGDVAIDAEHPVVSDAGVISAGAAVKIPQGLTTTTAATPIGAAAFHHIGLFRGLWK